MAFTKKEAMKLHPLYEDWMDNWVFISETHYLGYAPDNTIITRQSIKESSTQFLRDFLLASEQWGNSNE